MTGYQDIREFDRKGRYAGKEFTVTIWNNGEEKYFVRAVHVAGLPPRKDFESGGFSSADAAFEYGSTTARELIDG